MIFWPYYVTFSIFYRPIFKTPTVTHLNTQKERSDFTAITVEGPTDVPGVVASVTNAMASAGVLIRSGGRWVLGGMLGHDLDGNMNQNNF